jgi:putative transposase
VLRGYRSLNGSTIDEVLLNHQVADILEPFLVALMIDGVHFGEHVVLAAVGVDERGDKQVLGLREGATENAAAVRALLADLVERGLDTDRSLLIVIDGAKARHKAVVEVFGAHGLIQRCREHKKRSVRCAARAAACHGSQRDDSRLCDA